MRTTTRDDDNTGADTTAGRRRSRRRGARLLLGGAALATVGMLGTAGPASSAECAPAFLFLRVCNSTPTTTPTTTPPTTAPPLVSLPPVSLPPVTVPPVVAPPAAPVNSVDAARRLLDLTNGERAKAGLGALTSRDDITAIAVAHSERMAQSGDIFHSESFMSAATKSLLNAGVRGENVAYNGDIDAAHARLMASPGHRANILDGRFSVAGFGVVRHADGRWFITENFIQPLGAPRSTAPRATAAPAPARAVTPKPAAAAPAPAAAPPTAPPTTAPAPVPVVPPAPVVVPAPAGVVLNAGTTAASHPAPSTNVTGPLVGGVVVLLGLIATACWMIPRQRAG